MLDLGRIPPPRFPDVVVRAAPNWMPVVFLSLLGGVHLAIALPAAIHGRWEGSLSFFFAIVFLCSANIARRWSVETALLPSRRQIRVRTGTRRWHLEKVIAFEAVSAVRLTLDAAREDGGHIQIVCKDETLDFPPTPIAREQALFFSMMIDAPLVKVMEGEVPASADVAQNVRARRKETEDKKPAV